MRIYTAHLRPRSAPRLVREGFSVGALLFGGLWLIVHRAWIPGILALAASALIGVLTTDGARIIMELGLAVLLGLTGHDLLRWSLARSGYVTAHVLAAGNADGALARLLAARPDLSARFLPAGAGQ